MSDVNQKMLKLKEKMGKIMLSLKKFPGEILGKSNLSKGEDEKK